MSGSNAIAKIKSGLDGHVGQRIMIRANKGRKRVVERMGVLEQTYPSIFVVKLDDDRFLGRRVSYSYTDILTRTVELTLAGEALQETGVADVT
ncbi:MAG: Veg family protein [Bacillota bacterium]|jgi:uncharacterized protein Veg